MGVVEVILLVFGALVFTVSFFMPSGDRKEADVPAQIDEDQIREIIGRELEEAKTQINDIVDETITYSMEKTERSMERLTNEKIMAVNEYSDTVLEQINKNHQEAVFLYDMLNNKHENLKSTVSEAVKTASEVKQTVKDAEVTAREAEEKAREVQESLVAEFTPFAPEKVELPTVAAPEKIDVASHSDVTVVGETEGKAEKVEKASKVDLSMTSPDSSGGRNNNERILELHKAGKSNMAIAKELGLGIGEVKLVIDLFEGI